MFSFGKFILTESISKPFHACWSQMYKNEGAFEAEFKRKV